MTDTEGMPADPGTPANDAAPGELIEEYGPKWHPGPFEAGTDGPRVIVAGVDDSRTGLRAAAYAAGLARRQRSRLVMVHVLSPSAWTGMFPGATVVEQEAFEEWIADFRQQIRSRVEEVGVPVTLMVRRGEVFGELRDAATALRADTVVVGASEQTGHRLIGSIATRLVRAGRWPVTVVP